MVCMGKVVPVIELQSLRTNVRKEILHTAADASTIETFSKLPCATVCVCVEGK